MNTNFDEIFTGLMVFLFLQKYHQTCENFIKIGVHVPLKTAKMVSGFVGEFVHVVTSIAVMEINSGDLLGFRMLSPHMEMFLRRKDPSQKSM